MALLKFKKALAAVGVLGVTIPASLTVVACNQTNNNTNSQSQEIVNAVNAAEYQLEFDNPKTADDIYTEITLKFIKNGLTADVQKKFDEDIFKLVKIFNENDQELQDEDLPLNGTIKTKINYDYGNIKNQFTDLNIFINNIE